MSQYTLWCRQTWQENPRTDWRLISLGKSWIFDGPWLQSHANCDSWHRRVIQMSTMSSWRQVDADVLCPSGSQEQIQYWLVGGLEHFYIFPYIGNVIIPTDEHIFQRGRYTTNQLNISPLIDDFTHIEWTLVAQRRCQHRWSRGIGGALWGSWNRCWNPSYRAPCASWGSESRWWCGTTGSITRMWLTSPLISLMSSSFLKNHAINSWKKLSLSMPIKWFIVSFPAGPHCKEFCILFSAFHGRNLRHRVLN